MWGQQIFKVQFIVLLLFLLVQVDVSTCKESRDNKSSISLDEKTKITINATDQKVVLKQNNSEIVKTPDNNKLDTKTSDIHNLTSKSEGNPANIAVQNPTSSETESSRSHPSSLDAGALKRGFYVLIGLGVIVVAYFVFRSFRINNTRTQMIRKYGILAHRQDVEMRPLPLDEDDEDDTTVFDANNVQIHKMMQANS